MARAVGVLNLLQAAVLLWGASWLWPMWQLWAGLAATAGALQVLGAVACFLGRPELARKASIGTVALVAAMFAGVVQAAFSVAGRFGPEAADIAWQTLGGAAAALPWALFFPLWQSLSGWRPGSRAGAGAAGLIAVAAASSWSAGAYASRATDTWPAQPALVEAVAGARARWTGADAAAPLPKGEGPAVVLLTPWSGGSPGTTARGEGADLAAAVSEALGQLAPPTSPADGLVLDVARTRWLPGTAVPPSVGGGLGPKVGRSPTALWRPGQVNRRVQLPGWSPPSVKLDGLAPTAFDSAMADEAGARAMVAGWAEPPALTAESAREAALAGARMIARHQDADGRYAYVVKGPSGTEGTGYNFPRHAGATWFLARVAERTGDAVVKVAAERGLAYLEKNSTTTPDGRAYVRDPTRRDTLVWVGTTGLATLAAVSAGHPMADPWGRFLASSIDDEGRVRGEMTVATGVFEPQKLNSYGEGQTLLALASLVRSGKTEFRPALERGAAFVDGPYAPGGAGRLVVLDEHWACLAALAIQDVLGEPAGWDVCSAYLQMQAPQTPGRGNLVYLPTGAAGGLAEAVVAGAVLDPDGPHRERALAFGELFLRAAYREGDAPLLERPMALLGGFRDSAGDWDVRVDAVQHIGCALLGVEALLDKAHPGTLP